jgi:polyphosphate kinase 2 (PPK2 family)
MYAQRYVPHFPSAGEVVIFDRSRYNRAGVERVMGVCTAEQSDRFLEQIPGVEKAMVDSGMILLKYWLEVSSDEQTRRLENRIDDPRSVRFPTSHRKARDVTLPERQKACGYREPDLPL